MKNVTISAFAILLLAACSHEAGLRDTDDRKFSEKFGVAVRQNIQAQIVNKDAPDGETVETSGERAARQQERYQSDEVESPKGADTLQSTQSGSSGGD